MSRTDTARMIAAAEPESSAAPLLRREFTLDQGHGPVRSAELQVTALGVCEVRLNGQAVSPDLLTPGWSSYEWRLPYRSYDVTALLRPTSVVGITLGDGWYRGRLGFAGAKAVYGSEVGAWARLLIRFADGHEQLVGTDVSWRSHPGPVTANDLYDGQTIDARLRLPGWDAPGFDDTAWHGARELKFDAERLVAATAPAVRPVLELEPRQVSQSPSGRTILDFGENLVGWLRVRVRGPVGHELTFRHAEVLEDGELGVRPLRTAQATDRFVLSGDDDVFEPTFTFHGFRYVEVTGWQPEFGDLLAGGVTAVAISSVHASTGTFSSSHELLNRFHGNVERSLRGNFLALPTDCPQRDERLGWTGDISAFAPTAAFLADVQGFLADWLADLAAEQSHADGIVPVIVPDILKFGSPPPGFPPEPESSAFWSDAAVWVPSALWQAYGDQRVLDNQFASMSAHLRRVRGLLSPAGVWDTTLQFGDWLDPDAPPHEPWNAKAAPGVVATACIFRSARIAAHVARLLGREAEAHEFQTMADDLRAAFHRSYVEPGRIHSDCTTVYTLAIVFGLLDRDEREWAGQRLAALVAASGFRVSTGFAGTPFILDALSATGHVDSAYRLLLQTACPSWLYPVTMGATTVWERWDSMLPDGRINPGEMTSFNHYALGAVADWVHRVVGGIAPLEPGYRRILLAPMPGGGLTHAATSLQTAHGTVVLRWALVADGVEVTATVPPGTEAVLRLPGSPEQRLSAGTHTRAFPVSVPPAPITPGRSDLPDDLLVRASDTERVLAS